MLCDRLCLPVRRCSRNPLSGKPLNATSSLFSISLCVLRLQVYNIVPSISAITGVSPQRYFWRFSIALHIGPRIPIAFVYKNYYRAQLARHAPSLAAKTGWLINLILVLNCIEIASLGGVTYISNRENYRKFDLRMNWMFCSNSIYLLAAVHERIFITFMVCSLCYMLATIKLNGILNARQTLTIQQRQSIKWKKILFAVSILSTVGLLFFFAKHRFYCHDLGKRHTYIFII